jgi:hypothetical protein
MIIATLKNSPAFSSGLDFLWPTKKIFDGFGWPRTGPERIDLFNLPPRPRPRLISSKHPSTLICWPFPVLCSLSQRGVPNLCVFADLMEVTTVAEALSLRQPLELRLSSLESLFSFWLVLVAPLRLSFSLVCRPSHGKRLIFQQLGSPRQRN